jgi:hypothetical protein
MRSEGEPGERGVSAWPFVADRLRRPERGKGGRALGGVRFIPRGDVAVGERLSVEHHVSPVWL